MFTFSGGRGISMILLAVLALSPLLLITKALYISRAVIWGVLYTLSVFFCASFHPVTFRLSTIIYMWMFILTYITFYNILYKGKFSIEFFRKLLVGIIVAYGIVQIIQQILVISDIKYLPIINLFNQSYLAFDRLPSLSLEPSHSARILGAAFLSLLRLYEMEWGKYVRITDLYRNAKWTSLLFLWSMLTMGSGTAIICLLIIILYFINRRYTIYFVPVLILIVYLLPNISYKPIQRVYTAIEVTQTLESDAISKADASASTRILPFIYTYEHFDVFEAETWFGNGIDSGINNDKWGRYRMIGGMSDYGLLSYIFALGLIFSTSIRKVFSLETLFFIVILMAEVRSIYVWWSVITVFAVIRYFQNQQSEITGHTEMT